MGRAGALTIMFGGLLFAGACGEDQSTNDAVRDAIVENGVDPSSELAYEHFFYFDDETSVRAAERDLLAAGFDVDALPPDDEFVEWSVIATKIESLTADELDAVTHSMEELADEYGGTYDGWGTGLESPGP